MIIYLLLIVLLTFMLDIHSLGYLHIMQLESYINSEYEVWLRKNQALKNWKKIFVPGNKKPLVFTKRMKRLNLCLVAIEALLLSLSIPFYRFNKLYTLAALFLIYLFLYMFRMKTVKLANAIMLPIEKKINMGFYKQAQNKINSMNKMIKVGITGSYGKTSTKLVMYDILKKEFKTMASPESYNTPMGLSKFINNDLKADTEIFIAELGARYVGEIKEVAELVSPNIGILTNIGPCHLETFGSIDNIKKTKYELIEALTSDGLAIFNYDNPYIKELADATNKRKILISMKDKKADYFIDNVRVSELGTDFDIINRSSSYHFETKLLGKHNIYNIVSGIAVARELNVPFENIIRHVKEEVKQVNHRLNLVENPNGLIVIDDAFNSNPDGAKAALEVLSSFKDRRKIIVTPGMVELGEKQFEENAIFGEAIAKICDYVIIVGEENKEAIIDGLKKSNFDKNKIYEIKELSETQDIFAKITTGGDVILFENDLPDNYRR